MGSVRLEESGEWSGGVPECRTAHAAHQQRVESGGTPASRSLSFVTPPKEFSQKAVLWPCDRAPPPRSRKRVRSAVKG